MLKNLPAMQETPVRPLGWEDLLEKGMATPSSILAWRTPWTEEPGGFGPYGHEGSDTPETAERTHTWLVGAQSPRSGVKPTPPVAEAWGPKPWTARVAPSSITNYYNDRGLWSPT